MTKSRSRQRTRAREGGGGLLLGLILLLVFHREALCGSSSFVPVGNSCRRRRAPKNAPFRTYALPPTAPLLFDELAGAVDAAELQQWMRTDLGRRRAELRALGWLARAYCLAPEFVGTVLPRAFCLDPYDEDDTLFRRYERQADGASVVDCVVQESSVVSRGVPLRLRLPLNNDGSVASVEVTAVGCDIAPRWPPGSVPMTTEEAREICKGLNGEGVGQRPVRSRVAAAISNMVFRELEPRLRSGLGRGGALEPRGAVTRFRPRKELFAREGLQKKWLQKVSGYYFAESLLRDVSFAANDEGAGELTFTFYFDPVEPPNSTERSMNVNPEILCCKLPSYRC